MDTYLVKITKQAEEQLQDISDYIRKELKSSKTAI